MSEQHTELLAQHSSPFNGVKRAREACSQGKVVGDGQMCPKRREANPNDSSGPASSKPVHLAQWGCQSSIGQRSYMEDAHTTGSLPATGSMTASMLYGVFDGHGGCHVANFLAANTEAYITRARTEHNCETAALKHAFAAMDAALPECKADEEQGGSTAVVVMLDETSITCANCGDSRAVLASNGNTIPLSEDHKPDRDDEETRIREAGGRVIYNNHSARVMGVLSMSRAIGDKWLNKFGVIPEPDVKVHKRTAEDEFLIIASDGLWEVMSSEEAVGVARRCMERACAKGASRTAATRITAKVLIRAATQRGSTDNITVIVVDLRRSVPAVPAAPPLVSLELLDPTPSLLLPKSDSEPASVSVSGMVAMGMQFEDSVSPQYLHCGSQRGPEVPSMVETLSGTLSGMLQHQQQQQLCRVASQNLAEQQPQLCSWSSMPSIPC